MDGTCGVKGGDTGWGLGFVWWGELVVEEAGCIVAFVVRRLTVLRHRDTTYDCRVPRSLAPSSSSSGKKYLAASAIPQPATSQSSEYGFGNNPVPHTYVDRVGAISVVEDPSQVGQEATVFENVDGKRIEDGRYAAFVEEISGFIPEARQVGVVLLCCCCARSLARSRCALTRSLALMIVF